MKLIKKYSAWSLDMHILHIYYSTFISTKNGILSDISTKRCHKSHTFDMQNCFERLKSKLSWMSSVEPIMVNNKKQAYEAARNQLREQPKKEW